MGTLCCCTLQTLPPKVYSNSTRHSAGWKEKKSQGKVGKSTNKNPEKTTTTCSEWSRSQKEAQRVYLPPSGESGLSQNKDRSSSENGTRKETSRKPGSCRSWIVFFIYLFIYYLKSKFKSFSNGLT